MLGRRAENHPSLLTQALQLWRKSFDFSLLTAENSQKLSSFVSSFCITKERKNFEQVRCVCGVRVRVRVRACVCVCVCVRRSWGTTSLGAWRAPSLPETPLPVSSCHFGLFSLQSPRRLAGKRATENEWRRECDRQENWYVPIKTIYMSGKLVPGYVLSAFFVQIPVISA